MSSGALGRGSYRSVVAAANPRRIPTYYPSTYELIQLYRANRDVTRGFLVRDKVFDNKFPGTALANGLFKMVPNKRENYHSRELVEAIRHRTIWIQRIQQQRAINAAILEDAEKELTPEAMVSRFSYQTPDAAAYFSPQKYAAANNWPNYWQHPTEKHVVPRPRWRREPGLGGITRVHDAVATPIADF
ncbi:hypothetical protein ABL78_5755 [Leptomonas seymouri]|uniref:Uncharacterized protein n=1 Tax=Leptomonas seymouri TaxID=5684 RepID=A0A0N1HUR0_LEPSE|nr:hypothetical protein ABL78_5755 [Leptomonas seymouri]|eukprot:KPI85210.1 hypothetical protein ABL78_5755 [Leptomonas seymouri]